MKMTLLLAFSLTSGVAFAQEPARAASPATAQVDARFTHWLGCWRLEDDLAGTGARLCITPDATGVRLQTIVGKISSGDEALRVDGIERPIADPECKGTERADWSTDGQRVFRHTTVTCGDEPPRKVASIAFLSSGPTWVNVQFIEDGLNGAVRVQRYRRAVDQKLADGSLSFQAAGGAAARVAAAADTFWNVDDVIEASGRVPAPAVQAAVAEAKSRFVLNKKSLLALSDAGVADLVIDLMVGLAYPEKFVVESRGGSGSSTAGLSMGGGYYDPFMSPIMFGSMDANCYGYGGYGYRSYYSTCGMYSQYYNYRYSNYDYGGGYYPYYPAGGGGWTGVNPTPPGPGVASVEGRVVNGRGYTQVRPRDAEPTPIRTGNNGGNGSDTGNSGGNSGGSSNGASSQGYSGSGSSSGSSGDSGARTAVPRPPGGGF
ncbi:MAG: hypothetical protein EXQ51_11655 [Acidobacteria bacterium]|nr:hypothetical protein [Acidobacteriota bacterium]